VGFFEWAVFDRDGVPVWGKGEGKGGRRERDGEREGEGRVGKVD